MPKLKVFTWFFGSIHRMITSKRIQNFKWIQPKKIKGLKNAVHSWRCLIRPNNEKLYRNIKQNIPANCEEDPKTFGCRETEGLKYSFIWIVATAPAGAGLNLISEVILDNIQQYKQIKLPEFKDRNKSVTSLSSSLLPFWVPASLVLKCHIKTY